MQRYVKLTCISVLILFAIPYVIESGATLSRTTAAVIGDWLPGPSGAELNRADLPATFEANGSKYEFAQFGGALISVVDNPDRSGLNTSKRVARQTKVGDSEVWAGTAFALTQPIDLARARRITIKSLAPEVGVPILLKLENADDRDLFIETMVNTRVAGTWEELTFDFSGADFSQEYSKVVIFYDFGSIGTRVPYYFDDVRLGPGSGGDMSVIDLPLGFEDPTLKYAVTGFGGASTSIVRNPDSDGANTSKRVVSFVKQTGSEPFAGAHLDISTPIDLSRDRIIHLKVWSPKVGAAILMKLENPGKMEEFQQVSVMTTLANDWEELTFRFSASDRLNNLRRIGLFGDFDVSGTNEVYYFDDIVLIE